MKDSHNIEDLYSRLMNFSYANGLEVIIMQFNSHADGLLLGNRIALSSSMSVEDMTYTLAHELAHYFLHYDKGDTIGSERHAEYEEQADRGAKLLLAALEENKYEI